MCVNFSSIFINLPNKKAHKIMCLFDYSLEIKSVSEISLVKL